MSTYTALSVEDLQAQKLNNCFLHRMAGKELPQSFVRGEVFANIHFRIKTRSYRKMNFDTGHVEMGFSEQERLGFKEAVFLALSDKAGFLQKEGDGLYAFRGEFRQERLYAHPDDISGMVKLESIEPVIQAVKAMGVVEFECVDIYGFPELLDQHEMSKRLEYYKPDLAKKILNLCYTRRKDKFVFIDDSFIANLFKGLPGLDVLDEHGKTRLHYLLKSFVMRLLVDLVAEGLMIKVSRGSDVYWRATLKSELKSVARERRGELWGMNPMLT